ncbi:MAG: corrinoid protein [Firmicutes bacterium]|nr:corrinoid protein [Bacillota bacterium]
MSKVQEICQAVESGKAKLVVELVEGALAEGVNPMEILNDGMVGAMTNIGEKFRRNEIFVPEMLVAARAMKKGLEILKPHIGEENRVSIGKAVIGTVEGDLHDIGKNLVVMMVEGAGFEVIDLGVDATPAKFVEVVKADPEVKIVGLSALLTTTMPAMKRIIDALAEAGVRDQVKVLVGGAPVTDSYAKEIGADGYSEDAAGAADLAKSFVA